MLQNLFSFFFECKCISMNLLYSNCLLLAYFCLFDVSVSKIDIWHSLSIIAYFSLQFFQLFLYIFWDYIFRCLHVHDYYTCFHHFYHTCNIHLFTYVILHLNSALFNIKITTLFWYLSSKFFVSNFQLFMNFFLK